MFDPPIAGILRDDKSPDGSRRRSLRRRLGTMLGLASALALGFAVMAAPQPAQAVTSIDGQWTVSHGGTGLITLNIDGTYTSTCKAYANYPDAWCPAPSGTFNYGSAYVDFNGADGSSTSYRVSGLVSSPDTITSYFGSSTNSPLVMKKGISFVCTEWTLRQGASPLVDYDPVTNIQYLTGSHQLVTSAYVAETAPNYFQLGSCADFPTPPAPPVIVIDSAEDASVPASEAGYWLPQATVTIKDAAGAPVAGATVNGTFDNDFGQGCVTVADGTCTVSDRSPVPDSTGYYDMQFRAIWLTKDGMLWDGHGVYVDLHKPTTPEPVTHHIGDLDNATASLSSLKSSVSLKTASSATWRPRVAAKVLDANGVAVAGATISGTFSHHRGSVTCVTATSGVCTLGDFSFTQRTSSTVFTVTGVAKTASTYAPKTNSDPDGDSNGTTMTLRRP